jgi:hypothetical protein
VARPRRRVISEETQRALVSRQANLTALTKHPSWSELQAEVGRKRVRIEKVVLAKTLASAKPVDPVEMAYLRGFVHGMNWFSSVPDQAEAALERFLREQGVTLEGVTSG